MLEVYLCRKGNHLVPADTISEEGVVSLKQGETFRAKINRPRNYKHLQKYMVLMDTIFQNQNVYASKDKMRKALEMAAGHFDTLRTMGGEEIVVPASIDYASLSQEAFSQVYDSVCGVVIRDLLPGVTDADLKQRMQDLTETTEADHAVLP